MVFEGGGEDIGRGEEELAGDPVLQLALGRLDLLDDHGLADLAHEEHPAQQHAQDDALDRSWVRTTVAVVAIITIDHCMGVGRRRRSDPRRTCRWPTQSVDSRPRAPEVKMIDWPIIAHPAMPPNSGDRTLAMP